MFLQEFNNKIKNLSYLNFSTTALKWNLKQKQKWKNKPQASGYTNSNTLQIIT